MTQAFECHVSLSAKEEEAVVKFFYEVYMPNKEAFETAVKNGDTRHLIDIIGQEKFSSYIIHRWNEISNLTYSADMYNSRLDETLNPTPISSRNSFRAERISRPPGSVLARVAEWVYSKKTYRGVFEPILSDLQLEYQEALAAKRWHKAGWIAICGRGHFVAAALARIPISLTRLVVTLWKIGGS